MKTPDRLTIHKSGLRRLERSGRGWKRWAGEETLDDKVRWGRADGWGRGWGVNPRHWNCLHQRSADDIVCCPRRSRASIPPALRKDKGVMCERAWTFVQATWQLMGGLGRTNLFILKRTSSRLGAQRMRALRRGAVWTQFEHCKKEKKGADER